jgi:ribosomal protein L22
MTEEPQDTASDEKTSGTTETAAAAAPEPKAKAKPAKAAKPDAEAKPAAAAKAPSKPKPKPKAAAKPKTADASDEAPAADESAKPAAKARPSKAADASAPARVSVSAHAKYVRTSARKARLVCDHIRGKSVEEAYAILAHTPRHVAADWQKLLRSAVANAEHNHELVGEDLRIASVHADEGPTLKRFRPRAMGRASSIRKRTSHLSITLTPKEQ